MEMKYEKPVLYVEEFTTGQYVVAACTNIVTKVPQHGHVQIKGSDEIHCAFTSSNCGTKATECVNYDVEGHTITSHQVITNENGTVIAKPTSGHNCHILSTKEAALSFAETYGDSICGDGVAELLGLQNFEELKEAWS